MQNIWTIIWFVLALLFVIAEIVGPAFSFFIWFGAGAAVSGILALRGLVGPEVQILVFVVISGLLVLATKPLQKRLMKTRDTSMDTKERLIGKRVQVVEDINNYKEAGKVFLEGSYWSARSHKDNEIYQKEEIVIVIDVDGIYLVVKKP